MPDLPARFAAIIITFAPLFTRRSWLHAQVLLVGAILAPGRRTVASVLRITGHARDRHFTNYHRVLSRAPWNARDGARCLLGHLVRAFAPRGPIIVGLDDTIERRWGSRIAARGIYRDPVRSSHSHFVKTSGLRWINLMLLAPILWAGRVWALPFLTALVPSKRYNTSKGRRHKTLLDFGRQLALQARRWLPDRDLVLVADSSFSSLLFLHALRRRRLTVVTRLRLDAALYDLAPPRKPGTMGRSRKAGRRLATLARVAADTATPWRVLRVEDWYGGGARDLQIVSATAVWHHHGLPVVPIRWVLIRDPMKPDAPAQALLCTDLDRTPQEIVSWFVRRWCIETTFGEVRTHLGVETQRQWSDRAIARTTPCLLALFSIVTLLAARLPARERRSTTAAAWHHKKMPTFSDALAAVRRAIWREQHFQTSARRTDRHKVPFRLPATWAYALCNAA